MLKMETEAADYLMYEYTVCPPGLDECTRTRPKILRAKSPPSDRGLQQQRRHSVDPFVNAAIGFHRFVFF